ncbi:hypothetical protein LCGC14_0426990 [marine sediment metagenome]|uniref:DOD-type homing endonuclease domain-containing protein n=1 Tax=marine sediment metagenome TaxID=412755 RepID=A0A0F9T799_9ZZZZ
MSKKKVLCTGSCGFIFSNFVRLGIRYTTDYAFVSVDKVATAHSLNNVYAHNRHKFHLADVADAHIMDKIFELERPDIVVHGAAESVSEDTIIPYMGPKKIEHIEIRDLWDRFEKRNELTEDSFEKTVEVMNLDSEQQRALTIKNGFGQWRQIKQISRHWYDGPMIRMVQKWGEINVTPNHCIYNSNMSLVKPSEGVELLSIRNIEPSHSLKDNIDEFGEFHWKTSIDDLLFMVAFYITEGWASFNKANGGYIVGFCQNELEDVKRVSNILKSNFNLNTYINKARKCKFVTVSNKKLFENIIKLCGKNSGAKRLPSFIFTLNKNLKKKFIEYLVYFDGHKYTETNKKYTTNSRLLAAQLSTLFSMVGQNYSYGRKIHKEKKWSDNFNFQLSDKYNKLNKSRYEEHHYKGWVYDLEIDDTHKFVCGLGNVVVHNSHVDDSIASANPFIMSNVLGTQVIADACVKHKVERLIYISCYDSMTRAVTRGGLKYWHELNVGDSVLSINPSTGNVEEKKINKIIVQDYNGKMMRFKSERSDFCVTPNHRCIYTDHATKQDSKLYWSSAEGLFNSKNKYLPTGKLCSSTNQNSTINVNGVGEVDASALFYICGVFIADGFNAYQEKKIPNKTGLDRHDFLTKCRDSKTGKFIKTGKVGDNETTTCHSYRIFFDVPQNDKARDRLESCLKLVGIKFYSHKNKSGEHIYFSSKEWMGFFKQFGYLAKNKQIPERVFNYNYNLLLSLWEGIHDGDGHGNNISGRTVNITTVSDMLAGQLCYLGACIGFTSKIKKKHSISFLDGRKIEGDSNVVYFSQVRRPKISKPTEIDYSGKIWCLSVEDNKNFLTERNGYITYSGNTDEVYGQLGKDDDPWTENGRLSPRNPYSASKAAGELIVKATSQTHGLKYNITRSCNNYGPRQSAKNLVPKIIRNILHKKPVPIYGTGNQLREWIHVADNCFAVLKILESALPNETYNISAGHEISNLEMFHNICNIMGVGQEGHDLLTFVEDRKGHDFRYSVDYSKIKSIGWEPKFRFKKGLNQCINWYLRNPWFFRTSSA